MKKALVALALLFASTLAIAQQGNLSGVALSSAARTATANSADIQNLSGRGVHVIITTTAFTSGTFTPKIQAKDPASGNYYDLITGAAIAGTGTVVLKVYPGITTSANTAVSDVVPKVWRVLMTGASTPISTFSVGYFSIQ